MNFFLDTPIITEITLEVRTNIYDMISAIGGTLGLFTGISVITVVEVIYWIGRFLKFGFQKLLDNFNCWKKTQSAIQDCSEKVLSSKIRKNSHVKSSFI